MSTSAQNQDRDQLLVIDDESGIRDMLRTALEGAGYTVSVADGAEQAFEVLSACAPSVAVVDINLPGMNGVEICRRLSAEHGVDVILITGDDRTYSYEDAIEAGARDFILKPLRPSELTMRVRQMLAARRVKEERDESMRALRRLSITDDLTGLYNSRHLHEQLSRELVRAKRYDNPLSLIILDLDHFKQINDTHGHEAGDQTLQVIAAAIQKAVRAPDTAYRHGGEEFAVLLPETTLEAASAVAERLRRAIECSSQSTDAAMRVTASLGIAERLNGEDGPALIHRADVAMYDAKRQGRNRTQAAVAPAPHGEYDA